MRGLPSEIPPGHGLTAALGQLQRHVHFDSALVIHQPSRGRSQVVTRLGYSNSAAWALQNLFPLSYEIGFTHRLDPEHHLPPSISDVGADLREQFIRTPLFRRYLGSEGYRDGMSLELFDEQVYLGLVHFSARRPDTFRPAQRALAQSLSSLLALGLRADAAASSSAASSSGASSAAGTVHLRWPDAAPDETARRNLPLLQDPGFAQVLTDFMESPLDTLRHLWPQETGWLRVTLSRRSEFNDLAVRTEKVSRTDLWQLSLQELRVLSGLVIGRTDAEIAGALTLSERTVHSHMTSIRRKLQVNRRAEAAARAAAASIVIPGPVTAPMPDLVQVYRGVS